MSQHWYDIPAYDRAMREFVRLVMDGVVALHPIMGKMQKRKVVHSGPTRNVLGPNAIDHPLSRFEHTMSIPTSVIRESHLEKFTLILFEMANQYQDEVVQAMLATLGDITEASGNVIKGKGRPFTYDLFLDMLERMEIRFDAEGNSIMPTIVMNPKMYKKVAAIKPTAEQLRRQQEILRRKREKYNAQKRTRRLSR